MIHEIIGQVISIIGMGILVYSFQMKSNKNLFIMQIISHSLFSISYFCLGSYDSLIANVLGIVRCVVFLFKKLKGNVLVLLGLEAMLLVGILPFYSGIITIIMIFAQMVGTFALWYDNGKVIRYCNLCIVSPIWLIINIYVFMIGGILCEIFNIISILISLIRFRKSGFVK